MTPSKVYLIWNLDHLSEGHPYLVGVYSTRAKARKALKKLESVEAMYANGNRLVWDSPDIYRKVGRLDYTLNTTYIEPLKVDKEV